MAQHQAKRKKAAPTGAAFLFYENTKLRLLPAIGRVVAVLRNVTAGVLHLGVAVLHGSVVFAYGRVAGIYAGLVGALVLVGFRVQVGVAFVLCASFIFGVGWFIL